MLTVQGESYFDDMEAEEKFEEATGNAGVQMDRYRRQAAIMYSSRPLIHVICCI